MLYYDIGSWIVQKKIKSCIILVIFSHKLVSMLRTKLAY